MATSAKRAADAGPRQSPEQNSPTATNVAPTTANAMAAPAAGPGSKASPGPSNQGTRFPRNLILPFQPRSTTRKQAHGKRHAMNRHHTAANLPSTTARGETGAVT